MTSLQTKIQNAFDLIDALGMAKGSLPEDTAKIDELITAFGRKEFTQANLDQAKGYLEKMVKAADQEIHTADQGIDQEMEKLNKLRKDLRDLDKKSMENIASVK